MNLFNKARLLDFSYWPHLITGILMVVAYAGYRYFAYYNTWSDDAYVSAHVVNITSLVKGPVQTIYVKDNQQVKKGQKLVQIDSSIYQYQMNKAKADWDLSLIRYHNNELAIKIAQDNLKESQALLSLSQDHFNRYKKLEYEGDLAQIRLIDVEAKIKRQEAAVLASSHALEIAQQNFDDNEIKAKEAIYQKAKYLYEHTSIYAPADGYVTNFNVRVGQYIAVGEGLFALVESKRWWIVTRYRETAIRLIKPGDKVKIKLDMYPGKVFWGHVHSIGWGINRVQSGQVAPSTLVYMEPTEYWIKIAQRFPVRIYFDELDPQYPLRIGASATTTTYH